jgi:adhesin transport system outer membrane protein
MQKPLVALVLAAAWSAAPAQTESPVTHAVRQALEANPDVASRASLYRAAGEEIDVAAGAFKPHVDVSAEGGARNFRNTALPPYTYDLSRYQGNVSASQLLWDGAATRNEVRRLDHARLLRWFEFLDTAEQTGQEAARAWYDVVRYRQLVALAEDNYVQHRLTYEQVQSRVKAGVGRGVDLEQVAARLALAQSTVVEERGNLHDVTERYRRVVGAAPPATGEGDVEMKRPLPETAAAAVEIATTRSPAIAASIENLRAARAALDTRRAAYQPTVQARVVGGWGHNVDGQPYETHDATAEIVLQWNLFNGGSDSARERQYAALLTDAENQRDKACDDARQSAAVAFDDVRRLREQLGALDRNVIAIGKARDAYRQQFEIGQRSLLDLLNSENELYTARRSYVMARQDLAIAVVRTYAAMGTLVANLGLAPPDAGGVAAGAEGWSAEGDGSGRCPVVATEVGGATFEELDARARALAASREGAPATAPR